MNQLDFWSEELPANHSVLQGLEKDLKTQGGTLPLAMSEFLTTLDPSGSYGKTCQVSSVQMVDGILVPFSGRWSKSGMGGHIGCLMLNTLESHKDAEECLLSDVLETGNLRPEYYLSPKACAGILRRAKVRNKKLPELLYQALLTVSKQLATTTVEPMDSI